MSKHKKDFLRSFPYLLKVLLNELFSVFIMLLLFLKNNRNHLQNERQSKIQTIIDKRSKKWRET